MHGSARTDGNFTIGRSTFSSQENERKKDFGLQMICDAEFLGIVQESGVYMEADQMKRWLGQAGFPCWISRAELEIQGKDNAGKVQESLRKTGITADIAED